jgi:hypothetical protein
MSLSSSPASQTQKLHIKRHTYRTFALEQVDLNAKVPICGAFAKPSDGLEPSTPSLPFSSGKGSKGKRGTARARKSRNPNGSAEEE